jgi:hypothetical protein
MLIEQICQYLVSEIIKDDRTSSLRRICALLSQLEPPKVPSPSAGPGEEAVAQKSSLKFVYVQNPFVGLSPDSSALLSSPNLSFRRIYAAFESNDFSFIIDTKTNPIDPSGPVLPILLIMLYIKLLRTTPEHTYSIYNTMLIAKERKSDFTWNGRNGRVKFETLVMAIMDRRLRFGGMNPTKVDMWFNEMFETGELIWIEQKNKAQEEAEAEIWGVWLDNDLSSPFPHSPAASSSRLLADRSERRLKPLLECFERIRSFTGVSDKIVLSNLKFLLIDKRALPDEVLTEENATTLLGLVRNYIENLPIKEPASTPSVNKSPTSTPLNTQKPDFGSGSIGVLSASRKFGSEFQERTRDAIVECILKIFSRWCKYGSPRWNRPSSDYLERPTTREWNADEGAGTAPEMSTSQSRSIQALKRLTMAILNEYILKILQTAPRNHMLMTRCFVALAYSTIVLRSPEKDIPTQVFIHYMQYGPLNVMNRSVYWEMIDAVATLMRHLKSLDQFLELASLVINSWNTMGSTFDSRPAFPGIPLPTEAQHLPPNPLFNAPTRLHVSPTHPSPPSSIPHPSSPNTDTRSDVPSTIGDQKQMASASPPIRESSKFMGEARKRLPPLQNQRDIFSLFRMVVLWRRFDQGWSESSDDELQALALTIQYHFVNGVVPAQAMSLMAAMGVLDALVQSKSLSSNYTITVFNNILNHATMRVAMNDMEIRNDWRSWRQSVVMIFASFDQSFPNIDDTLLLQMVTDVLLEDAMNVEYLFQDDPKADTIAETMKKIESQKSSYLFRIMPLLARSLASLFEHTKNAALHDAIMYKLHSYAGRLHQLWRVYQPKYRKMHSSLQQQIQQQSNNTKAAATDFGGGVEKAAKQILEKIFSTFVYVFDAILPSLSYRQITRAIEALGFLEFASSNETEEGPYSILLEKLVDQFHAVRPADNWIVSFMNLGIPSIFGGSSNTTQENSLKLDKPSLIRIKQYFTVVQHTCAKYPHMLTRSVLEQRGLLCLLFWMMENPYKAINRKAHQTFSFFFLQPKLLASEPYLAQETHIEFPLEPQKLPSVRVPKNSLQIASIAPSAASSGDVSNPPPKKSGKRKRKQKQVVHHGSASVGPVQPGSIQYLPKSFVEEILPYYWRLTLDNYPEKTRGESILLNLSILLGGTLPAESPLIPFLIESLMDKLASLRFSKSAAELTRIVLGLISIVPLSYLPTLLSLVQEYVSQCPKRLQRFLCASLLESISKNQDYSRKEICTNWYMLLVDSLELRAKL